MTDTREYEAHWLHEEARYIHRTLFGVDAPEKIQEQYASARRATHLADWPTLDIARLNANGIDLEALELALRRRRPRNALTQRFQMLCYLAEVRPENYERFINEQRHFVVGWVTLGAHLLRSLYKLAKGRRLMRVYGIR